MSEDLLPYQPSLASATNTRVDSACKHHHQCRVSTDDLLGLVMPNNDVEELKRNKYKYCAHKDELVVGVGRPWAPEESRKKMNNAYPRVITNLGMMDGNGETRTFQKMITYMYHYCCGLDDKKHIINWFRTRAFRPPRNFQSPNQEVIYFPFDSTKHELKEDTKHWLSRMFDYTTMGYAQTLGYAHPTVGDTMTTVMIGGMRTVMNGDFQIENGDEIQWYWPFEKDCFKKDGTRKKFYANHTWNEDDEYVPCNIQPNIEWTFNDARGLELVDQENIKLSKDAEQRHQYHNKTYGQPSGQAKLVAYIKPYYKDYDHPRMYDQMRVFAKAIGSCRPHEMCDIKICRQSL